MYCYIVDLAEEQIMHQSFVSTAPHLRGLPGNSRAKVQGNYFLIVPTVPGNYRGFNIGNLTPVRFSVVYGGAKSRVVTISPRRAGLIPGL